MEGTKAVVAMVVVQVVFAGVSIFYKLALNDGMDSRILIAYRYLFATAFLAPLAFFLERMSRPKMTWKVLMLVFFSGFFGGTLSQNLYLSSIRLTSATFPSAMTNLIPSMTFILAIIFRLESLEIGSISGRAKIFGTLTSVGGAMLLTFYKGVAIAIWPTHIHLLDSRHNAVSQGSSDHVMGSILAIMSCLSSAIWFIIQEKISKEYPCHYSSTALLCLMAAAQSVAYALCVERNMSNWKIGFDVRFLAVAYSGVVASGLILTVMSWCIKKKGPLFASAFYPLLLVIVALLSSLLLDEKLHLGSVLGSALIMVGLFVVLWGKWRGSQASNTTGFQEEKKQIIHLGGEWEHRSMPPK
ncbi:WAT1-related protein At1g68170-like [Zingiber officinale]|uniref:WAT1-related protein At1g68170-like n=1 Tax=Zingiber officinale TaxID=94328 RepID=UPI001C4B43FA|nr:WAT1-related protein At1g68170-like [Zingiber officinale]